MQGRPEMGCGAGLASGRLTFSLDADTLIDRLCHGRVIHSCLSFTHTRTHTHTYSPEQTDTESTQTNSHKTAALLRNMDE